MMSMVFVIPNSDVEQAQKDKVRSSGAYSQLFSPDSPENNMVSYPLFGIQQKTQHNEALLLASERDSISRGNHIVSLAEPDFLVGVASVAMFRLDLTCSS